MKSLKTLFAFVLITTFSVHMYAQEEKFEFDLSPLEIPFTKYTLSNGLTLVVHEDRKAPIVAVNVWYHVGSKNEPEGKSGFAHLFEHLMFNGSENYNDDYFQAMERIGATSVNGTTWLDRTNYFENVPTSALDIALWMESDRMGHFKGAISQERLDEQRDVVKNEKRQGENQPYGQTWNFFSEKCFPKGHPYNHTTIGSMDDLSAASLDDVKEWFSTYYGAANAVIVIAGDISPEEAYDKVVANFGDIPAGPPIATGIDQIAKRNENSRDVLQDRVPQIRLEMMWNVPSWGSEEAFHLDLAARVLSQGKNSRLYKRLIYDEQLCSVINTSMQEFELAGLFNVEINVKPGADKKLVEKIFQEEFDKFLNEGPTVDELNRVKTQYFAQFIRGMEQVGGFGGKSDLLASNTVYGGSPDYYMKRLKAMRDATTSDVKETAKEWLSNGRYLLEIVPFNDYETTESGVDRSKLPELGTPDKVSFPEIQKATLSNGMKVMLANRKTVPVIELSVYFDAGFAADQFAKPGTASLTMNMLDEGTKNRNSLKINDDLAMLGGTLATGSNLDQSFVTISALKAKFNETLALMSDVMLNPSFPQEDFERLKKQQIITIQNQKKNPIQMAIRTLPKMLYGDDHAYGNPLQGSGYESSVAEITREDLIKFYSDWFKPNNATIIAVGDIEMKELTATLEKQFKKWEKGTIPTKNIAPVNTAANSKKIFVMDKPDSPQTVIISGYLVNPYGTDNEIANNMMNNILGGEFTSRVNMNLREDKGWAYGAGTFIIQAKGQRPFLAYAPVQTDKTAPSMMEIIREMKEYISDSPATTEEFEKTRKNEVMSLNGQYETLNSVRGSLATMVRYNLSEDYYNKYPDAVRNLSLDQIKQSAKKMVDPSKLTWMIVGDRAVIEKEIKKLGIGEVIPIDEDGNILSPTGKLEIEGN